MITRGSGQDTSYPGGQAALGRAAPLEETFELRYQRQGKVTAVLQCSKFFVVRFDGIDASEDFDFRDVSDHAFPQLKIGVPVLYRVGRTRRKDGAVISGSQIFIGDEITDDLLSIPFHHQEPAKTQIST